MHKEISRPSTRKLTLKLESANRASVTWGFTFANFFPSFSRDKMEDGNSTTTQLLTLLNVSATKLGKRKWDAEKGPSEKLNKRKIVQLIATEPPSGAAVEVPQPEEVLREENDDLQGMCSLHCRLIHLISNFRHRHLGSLRGTFWMYPYCAGRVLEDCGGQRRMGVPKIKERQARRNV